jgi:HEAT repeat protein
MKNMKTFLIIVVTLSFAVALGIQHQSIRKLQTELSALTVSPAVPAVIDDSTESPAVPVALLPVATVAPASDLPQRVASLEQVLAQLVQASEYLMDRGQLPPDPAKIAELNQILADPSSSDRDRLQALRLLRRNNVLTDDTVHLAANWLSTATNGNVRETILQQLAGRTNAILREPLLRLATIDPDDDVREQAVENLRRFAGDAGVEAQLWQMLRAEPDRGVREEIADALRAGPASAARVAALRERALGPQSSLEERLIALRALQDANADASDVAASLALMAQQTQNPVERARLFREFDRANDPAFVPPLVQGLQDPNPVVRERAADALSDFRSDPNIQQWLRYVAENDADPRVRREAFRGLERGR